jgi:hypothetical protein
MTTHQKTNHSLLTWLMMISLTPLLYALLLAVAQAAGWHQLITHEQHFARINSYIYAHSYGTILLSLMCGIQMGQLMNQAGSAWLTVSQFILVGVSWLSFKSFADQTGMLLLASCWLAALFIDLIARQHDWLPEWYTRVKIKTTGLVIIILLMIISINQ